MEGKVSSAWENRSALWSVSSCPEAALVQSCICNFRLLYWKTLTYLLLETSGSRGLIPQASLVTCLVTFLFRVGQKSAKGWEVRVGKIRKKRKRNIGSLVTHVISFLFQSHSSWGNLGCLLMANKTIKAISYPQRQWGPKLSTPLCMFVCFF